MVSGYGFRITGFGIKSTYFGIKVKTTHTLSVILRLKVSSTKILFSENKNPLLFERIRLLCIEVLLAVDKNSLRLGVTRLKLWLATLGLWHVTLRLWDVRLGLLYVSL